MSDPGDEAAGTPVLPVFAGLVLGLVAGAGMLFTIYGVGVVPMLLVFGVVMAIRGATTRRLVARVAAATMFGGTALWLTQGFGEPAYLRAVGCFGACAVVSAGVSARLGCALAAWLVLAPLLYAWAKSPSLQVLPDSVWAALLVLVPLGAAMALPLWWWRERRALRDGG